MLSEGITETIDRFLAVLDSAPIDSSTSLRMEEDREWLETFALRFHRKLRAAHYHAHNVEILLRRPGLLAADVVDRLSTGVPQNSVIRMRSNIPVTEIAFELDALLSALRSAIDFVATLLARHIKGSNTARSISALIKMSERTESAPFGSVLLHWRPWLTLIKEYRDEYIHYRAIDASGGYDLEVRGGSVSTLRVLTVPRTVTRDEPDTRRRRANRDIDKIPPGAVLGTMTTTTADGQQTFERSFKFTEDSSHVPVESFCAEHVRNLEAFAVDALNAIVAIKFVSQTLPR